MRATCPRCGHAFEVAGHAGGRPRANVPVQLVLDAWERLKSVRAVARETGLTPGTVQRTLRAAGVDTARPKGRRAA